MNDAGGSLRARGDLVLGAALAVAFSPGWVDLAVHWQSHAWPRYGLAFAALTAWCVARSPRAEPRPRLGIVLIGASLTVQLVAALGALLPLARPALAGAVIGFLAIRGLAPMRTALLALFIVPLPHSLAELLGGRAVADFMLEWSAALVSSAGLTADSGPLVTSGAHGGLPLLHAMLGLGWYVGLRRGLDAAGTARRCAGFVAAGALVQPTAMVLACVALALGSLWAAEAILESLSWLVPMAIVVFRTERALESAGEASA